MLAGQHDVYSACSYLGGRGIAGLVWADAQLVAQKKFGAIVDFIPLGVSISDSVIPLLGFEDQIQALRRRPNQSVAIPHVLIDPTEKSSLRINLACYWHPEDQCFLLLVARAVPRTEIEQDFMAQVRARAMAEADATNKARQIARVNEELTRINMELQEFASVISHDLRSPLRRLRFFANDAERALSSGDKDPAQANLQKVAEQAKRMGAMLTGLLEYSRIGRKSEALEMTDTHALITEIIESIERPDGVRIVADGDWPAFVTVAQPLDIVMRNLVDNAVKHHDLPTGHISVHAEDAGPSWIFTVSDDGPGIAPEWHDVIFEPFKRVADPDDAPEGSGIGLALVKKTVEWVGGQIEISSQPDKARGTTIRVHWPKQIKA